MKALVAAGGYGTRLFPATKSVPKAMLPVAGKPLIQHTVEELAASNIRQVGILCRTRQTSIIDHFRSPQAQRQFLEAGGLADSLEEAARIDAIADIQFIFCDDSTSLGDALRFADQFVGEDPFVLALADEIGASDGFPTPRLLECYREHGCTVGASRGVGQSQLVSANAWRALTRRAKAYRNAPKTLQNCMAVPSGVMVGRYVCAPDFMKALQQLRSGNWNPDFLDAFEYLAERDRLMSMPFSDPWWHCGTPMEFLRANIDYAAIASDLREQIITYCLNALETTARTTED